MSINDDVKMTAEEWYKIQEHSCDMLYDAEHKE